MMRFSFCLFLCLLVSISFAQNADEELAAQFFFNEEYDKAEILYKKLNKKDPESVYIYHNYLECLLKQNRVAEAEKMVSKQAKKFKDKPIYAVDLGYIYSLQGKEKEQKKLYDRVIDETVNKMGNSGLAGLSLPEQLSSAFLNRNEFGFAKKSLLEARKANGSPTLYAQNLINIYKITKEYEPLINESLLVLKYDATQLPAMKANLIYLVDTDTKITFLQERASIYVQKYPENIVFDELLLWVFIQQKKFSGAYRQATAMDRRGKTEGKNLIELASICLSNKNYPVAIKCYDKVVEFGDMGYFYLNAKIGSLETNYLQVVDNAQYSEDALNTLVAQYLLVLDQFGRKPQTARSMKQLSDIYIYYKHDLDKGVKILEALVEMPRLQQKVRGSYKLALGDAMLMRNDVWDATLLYGQVDKEFKEDPLGQEAKFRNAKLSYYRGEFEWAKDQLDVLKTATSQLISNNAIELSLLIKDNTGLDSSTEAMAAFANAQLLLFQNKLKESLDALDLLPFQFPKHALEDEIYYTKAQIFEKQRDFKKAEEYYKNVISYFAEDILADNALYALAKLYEFKLNHPLDAIKMYERIIFDYNSSLFVVDARKRYKLLKSLHPADNSTP
ncbi:MAG: tetratricopeptide (TPR) repeat protein [Bacteroidia bacterium]|jgi:tetratricopeptide (TPR) repeat protein